MPIFFALYDRGSESVAPGLSMLRLNAQSALRGEYHRLLREIGRRLGLHPLSAVRFIRGPVTGSWWMSSNAANVDRRCVMDRDLLEGQEMGFKIIQEVARRLREPTIPPLDEAQRNLSLLGGQGVDHHSPDRGNSLLAGAFRLSGLYPPAGQLEQRPTACNCRPIRPGSPPRG